MAPGISSAPGHIGSITPRDITNTLMNAKDTLSSWDNCMSKAYCKWPVIVAIIIAGLIAISIVICCARCLCCGLECCCGCFSCCNACCPSPRRKKNKYEQAPQHNGGYQPNPYWPQNNMTYGVPQFASFDAPSKGGSSTVHADSLPAMPSWNTAASKQIEDTTYHGAGGTETPPEHLAGGETYAMGSIGESGSRVEKHGAWKEDDAEQRQPMLNSPAASIPPQYPSAHDGAPLGAPLGAGVAAGMIRSDSSQRSPSPYMAPQSATERTPSTRYQNNPYQRDQGYHSGHDNGYLQPASPHATSPYVETGFAGGAGYLNTTSRGQDNQPPSPTSIYTAAPSYHSRAPTMRKPHPPVTRYNNAPARQQSVQTVANGFPNYAPQRGTPSPSPYAPERTMSASTRYESVAGSDVAYGALPRYNTLPQTYEAPYESQQYDAPSAYAHGIPPAGSPVGQRPQQREELFYPPVGRP